MLNLLRKRSEATGDIVILISESEIRQMEVESETQQSVHAGNMTFPRGDAKIRYFPGGGRAFIYGVTPAYLTETENIAKLETNTVLRNLFDYGASGKHANIHFYVMMAALIITVFLLRN